MKNIFTALLIVFSTCIYAQESFSGVKGGFNYATADFSSNTVDIDNSYIASFYGGLFAEFGLKKTEDKLELGLIYHRNGTDYKVTAEGDAIEKGLVYVNQINLPLTYKKSINENLFLTGGAYLGVILYADAQYEAINSNFSETIEITDDFEMFEAGLSVGVEYNFNFGGFVELKYNYGLTNTYKDEPDTIEGEADFKNRFFLLGVGYRF
ncbi:porin family protein [Psychroflexus planctonicus]|uniref:Outer membrane protein beta-barrel domain-containing protein n=1 Tax=Psychroflexus planctonicus TaxID=1526575 RepID=A0ABQ1SIG9_9FLAO|nr:porin family protein [Psychroflexus planctonicus]GGE34443.1 hypothetical protein GCM10010832_13300 [Psychroflexus planctonicus]